MINRAKVVYAVVFDDFDAHTLAGLYYSRTRAEEKLAEIQNNQTYEYFRDRWAIDEMEIVDA